MTEEQLLLLNNLLYREEFSDPMNVGSTIGDILNEGVSSSGGAAEMSSAEWEAIYEMAKSDPEIMDLELTHTTAPEDMASGARMACFADSDGQAVAVFRGTGVNEWPDNVEGLGSTGTAQQEAALRWFNGLPYENVTVTGHSKGGNKAMYVMIMSDKAGECYSFDGQGFSLEFLRQYAAVIAAKQGDIHSISHYRDFVNILLASIAGDVRYYKNEAGIGGFQEYHCPNALFRQVYNPETGQWELQYELGDQVAQDGVMKMLNGFILYMMENLTVEEQEEAIEDLSLLLDSFMGDGGELSTGDWLGMLDTASVLFVNLKEYLTQLKESDPEAYEQMLDDLYALLVELLGVDAANIIFALFQDPSNLTVINLGIAAGLLVDAMRDVIRDFSERTKEELLAQVKEVEDEQWWDFTKWDCWYSMERAGGGLNFQNYADDVNAYYRKVIDINGMSANDIEDLFAKVYELDESHSSTMSTHTADLQNVNQKLDQMINALNPMAATVC